MTPDKLVDVLIVGAGPTGAALAIDLARRGLAIRLIDKAPQAFAGSRAKGIQPRTLELFDDLGVLDDVLAAGAPYPKLGLHLGPFTVPWRMLRNVAPTAAVPHPNTWLIPQHATERALHARLEALQCRAEFGREFIGLRQHADSVTTTVRGADGIEQIASRYVVGADGGASGVRKQLGIAFEGTTDERDLILIVDATVAGLARDRWHLWPGRGGFVGACPLPHGETFQWMIRLAADEEPPRDLAAIARRLLAATRDPRIELREIHWQSVFRPNIRLAARYRAERVFLAGDAAHVHTPAGAQGLNTGIQDACNLGWKLAQVLAGAPDRLLDTYEAERRPIAAGVLGLSTRRYEAIGRLAPAAIRRGKDERQLTLTYRGGPLAAGAAGSATLRAGDRAPDALLRDAAGRAVRLFDTFRGPHFSAIAYGPRAAAALDRLGWPTRGAALRRVVIDAPGQAGDHVLCDDGATFRRAYGVSQDALLIVRPDGHVAHLETRATPAAIAAVVTAAAAWAPVAGGEALTRS